MIVKVGDKVRCIHPGPYARTGRLIKGKIYTIIKLAGFTPNKRTQRIVIDTGLRTFSYRFAIVNNTFISTNPKNKPMIGDT